MSTFPSGPSIQKAEWGQGSGIGVAKRKPTNSNRVSSAGPQSVYRLSSKPTDNTQLTLGWGCAGGVVVACPLNSPRKAPFTSWNMLRNWLVAPYKMSLMGLGDPALRKETREGAGVPIVSQQPIRVCFQGKVTPKPKLAGDNRSCNNQSGGVSRTSLIDKTEVDNKV